MKIKINKNYVIKEDHKSRSKSFYLKNPYQKIDLNIVNFLIEYSKKNSLCDVRVCLHESPKSIHHDMIVLQNKNNFYNPHLHKKCGDTILCLKGKIGCFSFYKNGKIKNHSIVSKGEFYKVKEKVFHSFIPLSKQVIFFETRSGPFSPKSKAILPKWAPKINSEKKKFNKNLIKKLNEKKN
jgi:cupin fold WbuC family metalloprotein